MASRLTLSKDASPSNAVSLEAASQLDPDHHLWRNGRLWWVAFTVHLPSWQKERVRLSLGTPDLAEAGGGATSSCASTGRSLLRALAAARRAAAVAARLDTAPHRLRDVPGRVGPLGRR